MAAGGSLDRHTISLRDLLEVEWVVMLLAIAAVCAIALGVQLVTAS